MTCTACGHTNPERAKFCLECGTPAAARCVTCGTDLPPAAKFCLECGAKVGDRPSPPTAPPDAGARKVVTIVFADLVGSTALHERLDAESARPFMERYYGAMRGAVEAHGGTVAKLLGDGVMAVFGIPRVAEDDAMRAVRAAVAMQGAFRTLATEQRGVVGATGLRVAVNTGEVVAKDETEIIGDPVNVAARLQEQGRDGDVVIGEATRRLVAARVTLAPLGSVTLKGRAEAVARLGRGTPGPGARPRLRGLPDARSHGNARRRSVDRVVPGAGRAGLRPRRRRIPGARLEPLWPRGRDARLRDRPRRRPVRERLRRRRPDRGRRHPALRGVRSRRRGARLARFDELCAARTA